MQELTGIFLLATLTEGVVEYFVAPLLDNGYEKYIKHVAAGIGIVLCAAYKMDLLAMLVGMTPIHPAIGWVISGIIVGRGGNILNDIVGLVRGDGGHDASYRFRK